MRETEMSIMPMARTTSPGVQAPHPSDPRHIGLYEVLGVGGMGQVYLALDTGYTASIALAGDTVVLGSERFDAASGAIVGIR
jgi:hypothetical protein